MLKFTVYERATGIIRSRLGVSSSEDMVAQIADDESAISGWVDKGPYLIIDGEPVLQDAESGAQQQ